jgi:hypothetical protein
MTGRAHARVSFLVLAVVSLAGRPSSLLLCRSQAGGGGPLWERVPLGLRHIAGHLQHEQGAVAAECPELRLEVEARQPNHRHSSAQADTQAGSTGPASQATTRPPARPPTHLLDRQEILQPKGAQLPPKAAVLHAAPGCLAEAGLAAVDPHDAHLKRLAHAPAQRGLGCQNVGRSGWMRVLQPETAPQRAALAALAAAAAEAVSAAAPAAASVAACCCSCCCCPQRSPAALRVC